MTSAFSKSDQRPVRPKRLIPPCGRSETPHAAVSLEIEKITLTVDLRKQ
jgi:hypothetical protein